MSLPRASSVSSARSVRERRRCRRGRSVSRVAMSCCSSASSKSGGTRPAFWRNTSSVCRQNTSEPSPIFSALRRCTAVNVTSSARFSSSTASAASTASSWAALNSRETRFCFMGRLLNDVGKVAGCRSSARMMTMATGGWYRRWDAVQIKCGGGGLRRSCSSWVAGVSLWGAACIGEGSGV